MHWACLPVSHLSQCEIRLNSAKQETGSKDFFVVHRGKKSSHGDGIDYHKHGQWLWADRE